MLQRRSVAGTLALLLLAGCAGSSRQRSAVCRLPQPGVAAEQGEQDGPSRSPETHRAPISSCSHSDTEIQRANASSPTGPVLPALVSASCKTSSSPAQLTSCSHAPSRLSGSEQNDVINRTDRDEQPAEELPAPGVSLDDVIDSVWQHFPLVRAAFASRQIASGAALSAMGAFDNKLKAQSRSGALGFYETYRNGLGLARNTLWGGNVFAGYRNGRGSFEPWYLERETNKGGEFKAGVTVPLSQNRRIDARRSALWRARVARNRVEPEIRAELIQFVRQGALAYWQWVAAAENLRVAESLLNIARQRNAGLQRQVETGDRAEIDVTDNNRLIVSREAALIDAQRKHRQAEVKLSLFLRNPDGTPRLAGINPQQVAFPDIGQLRLRALDEDVALALSNRPETAVLDMTVEQLNIELAQARNLRLPEVNAELTGSQDVGEPTTPKRDKSQFELEAAVTLSVPIERRKAAGRIRAVRGKLAQVVAKRQFVADTISVDVQSARAALTAAHKRVQKATESVQLAERMRAAEQRAFELGNSTLLNLNLREQQAADAAKTLVAAQLEYFAAQADYSAALALGWIAERPTQGAAGASSSPDLEQR